MNDAHHIKCKLTTPSQLEAKLEVERKAHQLKAAHLESLRELGVDMTRYLVARQPQFGPEKEVIVGAPTSTLPSNHSSTI